SARWPLGMCWPSTTASTPSALAPGPAPSWAPGACSPNSGPKLPLLRHRRSKDSDMIPGLSTAKLIGLAAVALVIAGLFAWAKIEQADAKKWQATAQSYAAQRDQAAAVADRNAAAIKAVTADRDAAVKDAGSARDALSQRMAATAAQTAKLQKEVAD